MSFAGSCSLTMTEAASLTLLYDGVCPVCRNFAQHIRLQQQFGELRLLDARQPSAEREQVEALGLDLNQGFVLYVGDQLYFSDRAIHTLALMSTRNGPFNWLLYQVFRHPVLSRVLYPVLSTGRLLLLRLLGRGLIQKR